MGPVGRGLRDVTRRQYIKYSTGKLLFLPSGLTIKKTRRINAGVEEANMHWSGKTKRWSEIL